MAKTSRIKEAVVKMDAKHRVTMPDFGKFKEFHFASFYAVKFTEHGEIVLTPRELYNPTEVIKRSTLNSIDVSMKNLEKGIVGEPVDLNGITFQDEQEEQTKESKFSNAVTAVKR